MSDDSSQEEKQNYLRENILEKGYDANMFVDFLMDKKGEGGANVENWTMSDLQIVVKEFISMQSNEIIDNNPPQNEPIINNEQTPTVQPVINNNQTPVVQPTINNNQKPAVQPVINNNQKPTIQPIINNNQKPTTQPTTNNNQKPIIQTVTNNNQKPTIQPAKNNNQIPIIQPVINNNQMPTFQPFLNNNQMPTFQPLINNNQMPIIQPIVNINQISTTQPLIYNNQMPTFQPLINNNTISNVSTPISVKKDPLSMPIKKHISNDPLQAPKSNIQNDPLQSKQSATIKKKSKKYDPLSGGISPSKDPPKKINSSKAAFYSTNNPKQNNNNIIPQIQQNINSQTQTKPQNQLGPNMQTPITPLMQNQFNQQFFNQFPIYQNPLQQNQFNQQFQASMMQGQFPQLIIPNQSQQNINIQNNASKIQNVQNAQNVQNIKTVQNIQNIQNINNIQQNQKINQDIKTQFPQSLPKPVNQDIKTQFPQPLPKPLNQPQKNEVIKPIPEAQNKVPPPQRNSPQESSIPSTKDDIGILYGVVTNPTDESRFVDKTPLGSADNPSIQVGFPEKVEGGFFSKSYVTYLITTIPLNLKVRRRYSDFDWLRQILTNFYAGNVIPTTPRKNKIGSDKFGEEFLKKRMRTLEKFMNYLLLNPIIKCSQLLYDFISIENEADFTKKKKEYEKMKPPQNINENQSLIGIINIEVKKEKETFFENIKENINLNESLFIKLNENLKLLKTQIENITLKIDEIAQIWVELCKTSTKYFDNDDIILTYDEMNKLFTNWSESLKKHNNIIHIDIREYFKYVKNNFKSMKDLIYIVETNKNTFNKNERNLINKKEELFKKADVNKWELDNNDKNNGTIFLQDKNAALMKMIPKETNNVINMKKEYGYYLNRIIDEYERLNSINSFLHKKNLINACEKIIEIYGDFQRATADIHNCFQMKSTKNIRNISNLTKTKI